MKLELNCKNFDPAYNNFSNGELRYSKLDYTLAHVNDRQYKFRNYDDRWMYDIGYNRYLLLNFRLQIVYEIYKTNCFHAIIHKIILGEEEL